MKKLFAMCLALATLLPLCACGAEGSSGNSAAATERYQIGDTVSTDIFEFTLDAAAFTIALNRVYGSDYFTPKEYDASADSGNPFVASVGHTYVAFTYTVKCLDRSSNEFHDGIRGSVSIEYNGQTVSGEIPR